MKIFVTGGAGFIGSAVVRTLIKRGHEVVNIDALTYASNLENVSCVAGHRRYSFANTNICDRAELENIFRKHQPDAVMHLAAESHVDRSIDAPTDFINTNIIGTYNLLEAALSFWRSAGKPEKFRFHHISTDEVYGSLSAEGLFNESTRYDPHSPYSASKASSDHLVRAWNHTYGLPVVLSNCSNNYGPFQFPEKLIPKQIINALYQRPISIYGDGLNIRDWLYVDDHVEALLCVLESGEIGRSYNIGASMECTNIEIIRKLCRILDELRPLNVGSYSDLIQFVSDRPGHDFRYAIDANRIRLELGWKPTFSIEEGLRRTVLWYLENQKWWAPLLKNINVNEGDII